jgi:chemotaxis protein CheD
VIADHATAASDRTLRQVYLHPGEVFVSSGPCAVSTIVGSCVSVFLWDRQRQQGGLNHYLLPQQLRPDDSAGRFGPTAIKLLVDRLAALGSRPAGLVAQVFGGAHVLAGAPRDANHLGLQNVEVAFKLLRELRVPVLAHDVGGTRGRRIVVRTDYGSAWVKEL